MQCAACLDHRNLRDLGDLLRNKDVPEIPGTPASTNWRDAPFQSSAFSVMLIFDSTLLGRCHHTNDLLWDVALLLWVSVFSDVLVSCSMLKARVSAMLLREASCALHVMWLWALQVAQGGCRPAVHQLPPLWCTQGTLVSGGYIWVGGSLL
jgi:hypothetical protein